MPEYGAPPLWLDDVPVNPLELGLALGLRRRLAVWVRDWDRNYTFSSSLFGLAGDDDEPEAQTDEMETEEQFCARGEALVRDIQAEVGPGYRVELDL